jgi:hypothetical protein
VRWAHESNGVWLIVDVKSRYHSLTRFLMSECGIPESLVNKGAQFSEKRVQILRTRGLLCVRFRAKALSAFQHFNHCVGPHQKGEIKSSGAGLPKILYFESVDREENKTSTLVSFGA